MNNSKPNGWLHKRKLSFLVELALCLGGLTLITLLPAPGLAGTQATDPVLVGAGDIAKCDRTRDEATADLLDVISGTVFTLGDNVYPDGTSTEFNDCYDPSWGRHRTRTRPAPGNHDYHTSGATGYYTYFGPAASPLEIDCTDHCLGYYSYDLGAWHVIVLNSEIAHDVGSDQEQWLRADLAAHERTCTLAYWHKPRFSSGPHGDDASMQPFWQALYEAGADVVLNGHDHSYERFAPQDPEGNADPKGLREFVVGTGGAGLYHFVILQANSEVRNDVTWGVLKLTLHPTSYDWEFIPIAGQTFRDAGSADCVGATPAPTGTPTNSATPTTLPASATPTNSATPTDTATPAKGSATATATPTPTPSLTPTATDPLTPAPTGTPTPSATATITSTLQPTVSATEPDQTISRQFLPLVTR